MTLEQRVAALENRLKDIQEIFGQRLYIVERLTCHNRRLNPENDADIYDLVQDWENGELNPKNRIGNHLLKYSK